LHKKKNKMRQKGDGRTPNNISSKRLTASWGKRTPQRSAAEKKSEEGRVGGKKTQLAKKTGISHWWAAERSCWVALGIILNHQARLLPDQQKNE